MLLLLKIISREIKLQSSWQWWIGCWIVHVLSFSIPELFNNYQHVKIGKRNKHAESGAQYTAGSTQISYSTENFQKPFVILSWEDGDSEIQQPVPEGSKGEHRTQVDTRSSHFLPS